MGVVLSLGMAAREARGGDLDSVLRMFALAYRANSKFLVQTLLAPQELQDLAVLRQQELEMLVRPRTFRFAVASE